MGTNRYMRISRDFEGGVKVTNEPEDGLAPQARTPEVPHRQSAPMPGYYSDTGSLPRRSHTIASHVQPPVAWNLTSHSKEEEETDGSEEQDSVEEPPSAEGDDRYVLCIVRDLVDPDANAIKHTLNLQPFVSVRRLINEVCKQSGYMLNTISVHYEKQDGAIVEELKLEQYRDCLLDDIMPSTVKRHNLTICELDDIKPQKMPAPPPPIGKSEEVTVNKKPGEKLGMSIKGGVKNFTGDTEDSDEGIFIERITDGGAVARDSRLKVGQRILEVNGQSLRGATHQEAVLALLSVGDRLVITICDGFDPASLDEPSPDTPSSPLGYIPQMRRASVSCIDKEDAEHLLIMKERELLQETHQWEKEELARLEKLRQEREDALKMEEQTKILKQEHDQIKGSELNDQPIDSTDDKVSATTHQSYLNSECKDGQFVCTNTCICQKDECQCKDGVCIPCEGICDGVSVCRDGSDKYNCGQSAITPTEDVFTNQHYLSKDYPDEQTIAEQPTTCKNDEEEDARPSFQEVSDVTGQKRDINRETIYERLERLENAIQAVDDPPFTLSHEGSAKLQSLNEKSVKLKDSDKGGSLEQNEKLICICRSFGRKSQQLKDECESICQSIRNIKGVLDVYPAFQETDEYSVFFIVSVKTVSDDISKDLMDLGIRFIVKQLVFNYSGNSSAKSSVAIQMKDSEVERIRACIKDNGQSLMAKHKYLSILEGCCHKLANGTASDRSACKYEPRLALYVLAIGYIPMDEDPFEKSYDGINVEVREGLFVPFVKTPNEFHDNVRMGCTIQRVLRGTLGLFIEHSTHGLCGLTCAHVMLSKEEHEQCKQSNGHIHLDPLSINCDVYQPEFPYRLGSVVEATCKEGSWFQTGIDIALVKIEERLPMDGKFPIFQGTSTEINFESGKAFTPTLYHGPCSKFGQSSGYTVGILNKEQISVVRDVLEVPGYKFVIYNQMKVEPLTQQFAMPGDSGSPVFVKDGDGEPACIGIVVGGRTTDGVGYVTPITTILQEFGISQLKSFLPKASDIVSCVQEISNKVGNLEAKVGNMEAKVGSMEEKVGNMEAKVDNMEAKVDNLGTKVNSIDQKLDLLIAKLIQNTGNKS